MLEPFANVAKKTPNKVFGDEAVNSLHAGDVNKALGQGLKHLSENPMGLAQGAGDVAGAGLKTIINAASVPGAMTENVVGTAAQNLGVDADLMGSFLPGGVGRLFGREGRDIYAQTAQGLGMVARETLMPFLPTGPEASAFVRRTAANAIEALAGDNEGIEYDWMREQAVKLSAPSAAPASYQASEFAELVANIAARAERAGLGTGGLDHILDIVAPEQKSQLMDNARQLIENRTNFSVNSWYASQFAYESTERLLEARARMDAGEPIEQVLADVDSKVGGGEILRDLGMQIVLDPLNLFDSGLTIGTKGIGFVGEAGDASKAAGLFRFGADASSAAGKTIDLGSTLTGGGIARRVREWANADVKRLVVQTPDGNGLDVLTKFGDIEAPRGVENLPGKLGEFFRRTPEARAARVVEEASSVVGQVLTEISPDAGKALAKMGIKDNAALVALDVLMNPASDNVLGSGRTADQVREAL
ncbi:MAG TPA: hypothetical protein VEI97_17490, partial [bacterium]|nr:hypothetical protein [bacterium]